MGEVAVARHLARRFFASLSRAEPAPGDTAWAEGWLAAGEQPLWRRMSAPDRRHAIAVARAVEATLGPDVDCAVVAAALLHDVGKIDAGLGTWARAAATVWAGVAGRERAARGEGRVARYLRHDAVGGELLRTAGSDRVTVAWAAEHHLPPARWSVPRPVGEALKAADDD